MKHVQDAAEEAVRIRFISLSTLKKIASANSTTAMTYLGDGSPITWKLTLHRTYGTAVFDF
jgi:N-methylhydantoinase B/oxoprolinase/acetone carboxylase alpha subunit